MRSPYRYPPSWLGGFVLGESPLGGPNDFPVAAGVQRTIDSYLYVQWRTGSGSDALQAFTNAYNQITQSYVDSFNSLSLPVYTEQQGAMLDWVALGVYGFLRPLLPIGREVAYGAVNSFAVNAPKQPVNGWNVVVPNTYYQTTDDIFKRIMTWHLYRGDGRQINVRWIKRRVMRFLIGENGSGGYPITSDLVVALDSFGEPVYWPTWYNVDLTPQISVTFAGSEATIRIVLVVRNVTGGCIPNRFRPNQGAVGGGLPWSEQFTDEFGPGSISGDASLSAVPNASFSTAQSYTPPALASILQDAVAYGILELPGPYSWSVQIG